MLCLRRASDRTLVRCSQTRADSDKPHSTIGLVADNRRDGMAETAPHSSLGLFVHFPHWPFGQICSTPALAIIRGPPYAHHPFQIITAKSPLMHMECIPRQRSCFIENPHRGVRSVAEGMISPRLRTCIKRSNVFGSCMFQTDRTADMRPLKLLLIQSPRIPASTPLSWDIWWLLLVTSGNNSGGLCPVWHVSDVTDERAGPVS